ncbi:MAG: hypothetical protein ABW194_00625 [Novosphingobium sp.]
MGPRETTPVRSASAPAVSQGGLGHALAAATGALDGVQPILRHLLGATDQALLSDRIVAGVRSLLHDLARQLVSGLLAEPPGGDAADALVAAFAADCSLLAHVHALALEAALTERLHERLALDPVRPPLLEALIASPDPETAALAKQVLAAQSGFVQAQRRGELPLGELPGDLLRNALITLRAHFGAGDPANDARAAALGRAARARHARSDDRGSLLHRLIARMGPSAVGALDLARGGAALFATALALGSGQDRDAAVLATSESQVPRLALGLLASGVEPAAVERQVNLLHPEATLPAELLALGPARAAELLAGGGC